MADEGGEGVKKRPRPGEDPKTTSLWRPELQGYISAPGGEGSTSTGSKELKGLMDKNTAKILMDAEHPAKNPKGHYINCCLDEMLEYNSRRWWERSCFDVLQGNEEPFRKAMRVDAGEACERWTTKVANLKQHIILIWCSESWAEHVTPCRAYAPHQGDSV